MNIGDLVRHKWEAAYGLGLVFEEGIERGTWYIFWSDGNRTCMYRFALEKI